MPTYDPNDLTPLGRAVAGESTEAEKLNRGEMPVPTAVGAIPEPVHAKRQEMAATIPMFDVASQIQVEVPAEQATQAFESGRFNLMKGGRVGVRLADGRLGTVPTEKAQDAIDKGARFASNESLHIQKILKNNDSAAKAFGVGVVRGALPVDPLDISRGLRDNPVFADEAEDETLGYEALEQQHPTASGAGQLVGFIGSAALTPGGGVVGGIGKIGERAGIAAAERFGTGLAGRIGEKVLPAIGRGAVEGAVMGAQGAAGEALADHDLDAEKALAQVGYGALFGATTGLVTGAVGSLAQEIKLARGGGATLPAASPEAVASVSQKQFGFVPKSVQDLYRAVSSVAAGGGGEEGGIIEKAGALNQSAEAKTLRRELTNSAEIRNEFSRDVREHVDDLLQSTREITDEARGPLKRGYIADAVKAVDPLEAKQSSAVQWNALKRDVAAMTADPKTYGLKAELRDLGEFLTDQENKLDTAIRSDNVAEQYALLDDTKRFIGRQAKAAQAIEKTSKPLNLIRGRATRDQLQTMYERLRTGLEDEGVWKKAALNQKEINAAWSKQIDASNRFNRALTTDVGGDPANSWRTVRGVDPKKSDAYVRGLTNPNNDLTHQAVKDYVASSKELAQAIGKSYDLPPEKLAQLDKATKAADAFGSTIARAEDHLVRVNQFEELLHREGHGHSIAGVLAGAALGGGVGAASGHEGGGLEGAALGALAGGIMRPGHAIRQMAQIERLIGKTTTRVGSAVSSLVGAGRRATALFAPVVASVRRGVAEYATRTEERQAYHTELAQLRAAVAAPHAVADRVAARLVPIAHGSPKLAESMASGVGRITTFLAGKIPWTPPGDPMDPGAQAEPSEDDRAKFMRYIRAAKDPVSILDDAKAGRLTPEAVETAKACFPRLYNEMRRQVTDRLTAAKEPPSYQQRIQLGMLFDLPTDATLEPSTFRALQATYAASGPPAKPPQGRKIGSELRVASQTETAAQRLEKEL